MLHRVVFRKPGARSLAVRCFGTSPIISESPVKKRPDSLVKNYMELSKFRLSSLVVFTSGAGFIGYGALPTDLATAATLAAVCGGTMLCAASAGAFNQIVETDRDASMKRTFNRPLPSGKISKSAAVAFGIGSGALGTGLLLVGCNPTVAALGLSNIALYGGAYTYSKQVTEWNTWIGAVVGAIPPVMGWAAASGGSFMALEPLALASALFLWQFPHFFSLAWMHREDYARGRFQMVPVNDPSGQRTADLVWNYSLYLSALPFLTSAAGLTSCMFCVEGAALNGYLLYCAKRFKDDRSNSNARKVFLTSLGYLPLLLAFYLFHANRLTSDDEDSVLKEAKEYMKGLCVHETIASGEASNPALCPVVVAEDVKAGVEKGADALQQAASEAAVVLSAEVADKRV